MKTLLIVTLLLILVLPTLCASPCRGDCQFNTVTSVSGVNLSWDDCSASLGLGLNKTSTCQSNTESAKTMYGSYVLPQDVDALVGNDIVLDIFTNSATLPCWWNFTIAPRSMSYDMVFDAVCPDNNGVGIVDYWSSTPGGPMGGSVAALLPTSAVPRIRIRGVVTVDESQAQPVPATNEELYSFTFRIRHEATVGACTGCLVAACVILESISVTQSNSPSIELASPASRDRVFWQGGAIQAPGCLPCPCATENKSWGAVKALYR